MAETVDISNFNQLLYQLEGLTPQQLQQVGMMHHDDLAVMSAISHINSQRQKMAQAMMAQRAMAAGPMPTVAQQVVQQAGSLPENMGIAQVAPDMNIPGGGITGEEEPQETRSAAGGGMMHGGVERYAEKGYTGDGFDDAFNFVMGVEGDKYVPDDAGKGPSKFGINAAANPDVDVKSLTKDKARELYKRRYWDAIGGDALAAKNPALAKAAFDTAVNMGVGKAKQLISASGGDPAKLLELRKDYYNELVKTNPKKFSQYAGGWDARLEKLGASLPISAAQAAEAQPSAISQIPREVSGTTPVLASSQIPGQTVQAPTAVREEPGFFKRQAERLGLSEESQRNIANLNTALAGAMGPAYIPNYVPSRGGILSLADRGGQALYNKLFPAPGLTQAEIKAMQAANAVQAPVEAAEAARMAGALPGEAEAAAAAVRAQQAANAAKLPSAAEKVQAASRAREAADATRFAQAARTAQTGAQAAAAPALIESAAATGAEAASDGSYDRAESARFLRQATEGAAERLSKDEKKQVIELAKEAAPEGKKQGFTAEDWIQLGLGLMAGESPYAMQNLGKAGLGVLKARQEARKEEREDFYRRALAREAIGKAKYYESGTQGTSAAMRVANEQFDNWFNSVKGTPDFMLLQPDQRDAIVERKRQQYLREAFAAYNLPVPTGVSTADAGGFKVLGSRPS